MPAASVFFNELGSFKNSKAKNLIEIFPGEYLLQSMLTTHIQVSRELASNQKKCLTKASETTSHSKDHKQNKGKEDTASPGLAKLFWGSIQSTLACFFWQDHTALFC